MCGGIFTDVFIGNFSQSVMVKNFLKLVSLTMSQKITEHLHLH